MDGPLQLPGAELPEANVLSYTQDTQAAFAFGGGLAGGAKWSREIVDDEEEDAVVEEPAVLVAGWEDALLIDEASCRGTVCVHDGEVVFGVGCEVMAVPLAAPRTMPRTLVMLAHPVLQLCSDGGALLALRSRAEIRVYRGVAMLMRITPALLRAKHHEHSEACFVSSCAFGLRRGDVLWTTSCGLCLCSNVDSQLTLCVLECPSAALGCLCVGHSRRFVCLTAAALTLVDYTVSSLAVPLLGAETNEYFVAMAVTPLQPHVVALVTSSRTALVDARVRGMALLSRAHILSRSVAAVFFVGAHEFFVAAIDGVVMRHRVSGAPGTLVWRGRAFVMETSLARSPLLLAGCCAAGSRLVVASAWGDLCVEPVRHQPQTGAEADAFASALLWRRLRLQTRSAFGEAPYAFGNFLPLLAHWSADLPCDPATAQAARARVVLESDPETPSLLDPSAQEMLAELRVRWDEQ